MQVRLTVEDGGVAGPGGHDEDVDVEVDGDVAGPDGHDVTEILVKKKEALPAIIPG